MNKINLLCIPYSGGSKYSFLPLLKFSPEFLNPIVLELPGRGGRSKEGLLDDIKKMELDVFGRALKYINGPYAIYGHSMGGLLSYLLVKNIVRNRLNRPVHLFITGTTGPSAGYRHKYHSLSKKEFLEQIRKFKGMPDEILDNEDMMDFFEPIMRSDFKAAETYTYQDTQPFDIPISVVIGDEEDMEYEDVRAWEKESNARVEITKLNGNHFFIFDHGQYLMKYIGDKILASINTAYSFK
jgi:surfactin synthase thioesterase subunit